MRITINVPDKKVIVDGVAVSLPNLDWGASCFVNDPGRENDDVDGVEFDTERGAGLVMYKTVQTKQSMRPPHKGPDCPLMVGGPPDCDFFQLFGWVLPIYEAERVRLEAEAEKARVEAERAAKEAAERAAVDRASVPSDPMDPVEVSNIDIVALKEQIAELQAKAALADKHEAVLTDILKSAAEDAPT